MVLRWVRTRKIINNCNGNGRMENQKSGIRKRKRNRNRNRNKLGNTDMSYISFPIYNSIWCLIYYQHLTYYQDIVKLGNFLIALLQSRLLHWQNYNHFPTFIIHLFIRFRFQFQFRFRFRFRFSICPMETLCEKPKAWKHEVPTEQSWETVANREWVPGPTDKKRN